MKHLTRHKYTNCIKGKSKILPEFKIKAELAGEKITYLGNYAIIIEPLY
jgi:hypothetical protein